MVATLCRCISLTVGSLPIGSAAAVTLRLLGLTPLLLPWWASLWGAAETPLEP